MNKESSPHGNRDEFEKRHLRAPEPQNRSTLESPLNPLEYDDEFADAGKLIIARGERKIDWASSIAQLKGQSNYVASFYEDYFIGAPAGFTNFAGLVRFDANGNIDKSFGSQSDGIVEVRFAETGFTVPKEVIEFKSGALLVWGTQDTHDQNRANRLTLLTQDGNVYTGFGNQGVVDLGEAFAKYLDVQGVIELADGRIVVAALEEFTINEPASYLIRLHPDGRIDESFGARGIKEIKRTSGNITYVAGLKPYERDSKLLVYGGYKGLTHMTGFVALFDANGEVDSDFGNRGFVDVAFSHDWYDASLRGMFIAPDENHILVAGSASHDSTHDPESMFMKYLHNGSVDKTFNYGLGPVTWDQHPTANFEYWHDARTLPGEEGKILVLGYGARLGESRWYAVGRFDSSGELDESFANGAGMGSPVGARLLGESLADRPGRILCTGDFNGTAAVFALKV
jgi:uncharacterized delta-60 repeat protein